MGGLPIDRYAARIGFSGSLKPDFETLCALHRLHPASIPFENFDPVTGELGSLEPARIFDKMVDGQRGGWCYEQGVLFFHLLQQIGFDVAFHLARPLWNKPPGIIDPRVHLILTVRLGMDEFLVDTGFGGLTLTAPLSLRSSDEQPTPNETFRLRHEVRDRIVEADLDGVWKPLYRFETSHATADDIAVCDFFLRHNPNSMFRKVIMAARVTEECRVSLMNNRLTVRLTNNESQQTLLDSQTFLPAIREHFGIELAAEQAARLRETFDRVVAQNPA